MNLSEVSPDQLLVSPNSDYVSIRGERLALDDLTDPRLDDESHVASLREKFLNAHPFPHLVIEDWFNPRLLALAEEEFDLYPAWFGNNNKYETTRRSAPNSNLGSAARLYFDIVHSRWFLNLLTTITSVEDLMPDPYLYGGGLHESRNGGRFGIHRDFDRHVRTGLQNQMVLLTYLNRNFDSAWNGDLELWDANQSACVSTVRPDFGRSILMLHGKHSYHGHPRPLAMPEGHVRRSMASYYYTNTLAAELREKRVSSVFLFTDKADHVRQFGKRWTPPALWDVMKRFAKR